MMAVAVLAPDGVGRLARHALSLGESGVEPSSRPLRIATDIAAVLGRTLPRCRLGVEPGFAVESPAGELATVVLLVAAALEHSFAGAPVLAVGLAAEGRGVTGVAPGDGEELLRLAGAEGVVVEDRRPGVGVASLAERVRERGKALGLACKVHGVTELEHVLTAMLGGDGWRRAIACDAEQSAVAAEQLFRTVLRELPNWLGWEAVASLARGHLVARASEGLGAAQRWKIGFSQDVARRHLGESVMPVWPEESVWLELNAAERLAVAAHLVQGAADAAIELVPEAIRFAGEVLEERERGAPERAAELWGAIGRAQAAVGRAGEAIAALTRACEAWQRLGRTDQMSFAASELVRMTALAGLEARGWARACVEDARTSEESRGYVRLAEARAAVQLGNRAAALALLAPGPEGWPSGHPELVPAMLRWRHRAQLEDGDDAGAAQTLAELEARGETDQLYLARLDYVLARGGDWREALHALFAITPGGDEAYRTWKRVLGDRGPEGWEERDARRLAEEYRY